MISKYMTDVFCLFSHIKYVFIYQDFSIIMSLDKSKMSKQNNSGIV